MAHASTHILAKLVNSLFEGYVDDNTVIYVLNNAPLADTKDEIKTMNYLFTCSASIAQLAQKHHKKETLQPFFDELGNIISRIDNYMEIADSATPSTKLELLVSFRELPFAYSKVILADADSATTDSACVDLVIQSAINGMLMSVMEMID